MLLMQDDVKVPLLRTAVDIAVHMMRSRIIESSNDEIAVVFYGAVSTCCSLCLHLRTQGGVLGLSQACCGCRWVLRALQSRRASRWGCYPVRMQQSAAAEQLVPYML